MEKICVGIITKPQALKGEFRVKPEILNLKQFKKFDTLTINNVDYNVEKVSLRDSFAIVKVEGVNSCEDAELLRNKPVFAMMEVTHEDNTTWIDFECFVNGISLGNITDINNYGSKDILTINGKSEIMLPVIDNLIENVDVDKKTITFNNEIFNQVASYED
jgi:16S rRNA processing protein RimM